MYVSRRSESKRQIIKGVKRDTVKNKQQADRTGGDGELIPVFALS
jgi:hypothetical protein